MRAYLGNVMVCGILAAMAAGCIWPGQERVTGPRITRESTVLGPDGQPTSRSITTVSGAGYQGKRLKEASFDDVWIEHEARAGGFSLEGFPLPAISELRPLYIIGGLCIVAGVVVGWVAGWGLGFAIAGAGAALLAAAVLMDRYPWVVLLPAFAGAGVGVYLLVELYHGRSAREALSPIVQAIEATPPLTAAAVKEKVAQFAGPAQAKVKATVGSLKRKLVANG